MLKKLNDSDKKMTNLFRLVLAIGTVFFAVVATPVYLWSMSNVLVKDGIFPQLWDILQKVLELLWYWFSFGTVLYASVTYGFSSVYRYWLSFGAFSLLRYAGCLLAGCIMMGFDDFSSDVLYALLDVIGDCVQMGLVVLLCYLMMFRNKKTTRDEVMPFERLFDLRNVLLRVSFLSACIPALLRLVSRLIYDLDLGGAINTADLAGMIVGYATDVLCVPVGYLIMILLMDSYYSKNSGSKSAQDRTEQ